MAQEIVLHVRLVGDLILRACKDFLNQRFLRRRIPQRPDGNLAKVYRGHIIAFSVSGGAGKGKQHVLLQQKRCRFRGAHIVAHKDHRFRQACPQSFENCFDLRVPHSHKNYIIVVSRQKLRCHRNGADCRAAGKCIFDPQPVSPNLICPWASCQQRDILSCAEQIVGQIAPQNARAEYQNSHDHFLLLLNGFCGIPPHPGIRDGRADMGLYRHRWYSHTCSRPRRCPSAPSGREAVPWRQSPHCTGQA